MAVDIERIIFEDLISLHWRARSIHGLDASGHESDDERQQRERGMACEFSVLCKEWHELPILDPTWQTCIPDYGKLLSAGYHTRRRCCALHMSFILGQHRGIGRPWRSTDFDVFVLGTVLHALSPHRKFWQMRTDLR
jgi:hypothetical protein